MSPIPIIRFMFQSEWQVLTSSLKLNPIYETQDFSDCEVLSQHLGEIPSCLVLVSLKDKTDLIQLATLVKLNKKNVKNSVVKIVVVNFSKDKQFEKTAGKLGILDIVDESVNTKALRFKIDFWMKSISAQVKGSQSDVSSKTVKSLEVNKNQDKKLFEQTINWQDPLKCPSDIWILKNDADCKKILSKWLIKIMGPSPYVAQWVEVPNQSGLWKFDIKKENQELFSIGVGSWYFQGEQKPEFIWKENIWMMTGTVLNLFYQDDQIHSRFILKDKSFFITKNSDAAKSKEKNIVMSFDKELTFKKEIGGPDSKDSLSNEADILKNLEGKGKTEQLQHDPLSGKTKGEAALGDPLSGKTKGEVSQGNPLSGKTKGELPQGKPLSGKSRTDQLNRDPLSGKLEEGDFDEDGLSGKSHTDQLNGGPLAGKAKGEASVGKPLTGKSDTDKLKSIPLASTNKTKMKKAQEFGLSFEELDDLLNEPLGVDIESSESEDHDPTEDLNLNELASENKISKVKKDAVRKGEMLDLEHENNTHKTFYKGHNEAEQFNAKEKDHHLTKEAIGENLSGATHTDKLPSHMSSPSQENQNNAKPERKNRASAIGDGEEAEGQVLPFIDNKRSKNVFEEELSEELQKATANAKVISFITQNEIRVLCDLDDFFDQKIYFSTESNEIPTSGPVTLDLSFRYLDKNKELSFEAGVVNVDTDIEGKKYITVELSDDDVISFGSFMEMYQARQINANIFLARAKGF